MADGQVEPSTAVELLTSDAARWLLDGWSIDAVATPFRAGLGIAKDLTDRIDVGAYATTPYTKWAPALSIGAHWSF